VPSSFVLPRVALLEDNALKEAGSAYDKVGGARRDRTDDLLLAKQALSQLSYGPVGFHNPTEAGNHTSESASMSGSDF
jgi:hypothetical protein